MRPGSLALLVAPLLLFTACATGQCKRTYVAPPGPARPFLYEVVRPESGGSITVLGTWHGAGEAEVPPAAWAALAAADVFVAEVDEVPTLRTPAEQAALRDQLELPPGQSLPKLLSADDWYELATILDHPAGLERAKPWVAMSLLTRRAFTMPTPNIDEALLTRARALGKPTEFLERWAEQVAALDASVGGPQLAEAIHAYPEMPCVLADGLAAYRAGDEAAMLAAQGSERDVLLVERNQRWLPLLEYLLGGGPHHAFVAVGVGHLVGPDGLLAMLAARGFMVRRL
jgi:hypothetical protein